MEKREKAKENSTRDEDTDVGACGSSTPISADDTTQNVTYQSPEPSTSFSELPDNVAPSFLKLNVPEPIQKRRGLKLYAISYLKPFLGQRLFKCYKKKKKERKLKRQQS